MPSKRSRRQRTLALITGAAAAAVAATLVSLWMGNAYWLAGAGSGLGVWLGVRWGNSRAREVDEYREQWLTRRQGTSGSTDAPENPGPKNE